MSLSPSPTSQEPATSADRGSTVPVLAGMGLCLLLTVAQMALGGYQLGVGNQTIQIAFLKHWAAPYMYSSDPMVTQTMGAYPSYFFRLLAPLLHIMSVETLYLVLQVATGFATLATVYGLARSIYRSHATAIAAVALLVAGHLYALAGESLYSPGFTHTYAALPLAIGALALAYRGRWVPAFGLAGLLFNLHALTSAYTLLMLAAAMLADFRQMKLSAWTARAFLCAGLVLALASPTLALMARGGQIFDEEWINLTRIRSADHSFPSAWWSAGDADLPRFVMIVALFVLSWSFSPLRREQDLARGGAKRALKITVLMTLAVAIFFAVGYLLTEIWPVPLVIRLQPFRASRLLMIVMLVHIAHGAIAALRAGITGETASPSETTIRLAMPARIAEVVAGLLVLASVAVPTLLPLLPYSLLAALIAALIAGHLSWRQAIVAVSALLLVLLAFLQIQFPIPGLTRGLTLLPQAGAPAGQNLHTLAFVVVGIASLLCLLLALLRDAAMRNILTAVSFVIGSMFAGVLFARERYEDPASETAQMEHAAAWARERTPTEALFLTPTNMANFRIDSERSLVASWRDGTQIYFSSKFGPEWLDRITKLEPGLSLTVDGSRLASRGGDSLETLDDAALIDLAQEYGAGYILLHTPPHNHPRNMVIAYTDDQFTIYEPRMETLKVPPGVFDPYRWADAEDFMNTTVQQGIEKNRKADVTFSVVDSQGQVVRNLPIKVDQTKLAFTFGASLGFFEPNTLGANHDENPLPARQVEKDKLPEVFNGSMIPFSSKWYYIEPEKGKYRWSDLDKYVDYCVQNNLTEEFHH
ncbi:MAG TPA: DUF6798 domain-containing protein, partial [Phycisphaerae bacterium]